MFEEEFPPLPSAKPKTKAATTPEPSEADTVVPGTPSMPSDCGSVDTLVSGEPGDGEPGTEPVSIETSDHKSDSVLVSLDTAKGRLPPGLEAFGLVCEILFQEDLLPRCLLEEL